MTAATPETAHRAPSPVIVRSPAPGQGPGVAADFTRIPAAVASPPPSDQPAAELAADRLADSALAGRANGQPGPAGPGNGLETAPAVRAMLADAGRPLPATVRTDMEARFQQDFSRVRVHADPTADRAAASVGALAFALGDRIAFRQGRFDPSGTQGRRLLAHELAHVVQQNGGAPVLQRRSDGTPAGPGVHFQFSVPVDGPMDSDRLLLEFIRHYRRLDSLEAARTLRDTEAWRWSGTPPAVTDDHIRQGYILIPVTDRSLTPASAEERARRQRSLADMPAADRAALEAETDRRFWERTRYKVEKPLGRSADDRKMDTYRTLLRDDLMAQRERIEALPPEVRALILSEGAADQLAPRDYETALRVAGKLAGLTAAELAEYRSRTTDRTADWGRFEASVDRFVEERRQRSAAAAERRRLTTRLYGLEDVYLRYRSYRDQLSRSALLVSTQTPRGVGTALGGLPGQERERAELEAALVRHGFAGIADFEAIVQAYADSFREETVALSRVLLDRYEHLLREQERRYTASGAATALHGQLAPARAHYQAADRIQQAYFDAGNPATPYTGRELAVMADTMGRRDAERRAGNAAARGLAADHPLLGSDDLPVEALSTASEAQVGPMLAGYIADRRRDITETRRNIAARADLVFDLDALLEASYQSQNIRRGSIEDLIIEDRKRQVRTGEVIPQFILGVIAVAAGLLTGGGGTVAVLAAGTALGIGAYQALEEFRRYEQRSAAHGAGLLSDDPSFAWVIVALVGVGLDLAAVGSTLGSLRPAVQSFNRTGDLATLADDAALLAAQDRVREAVLRAARAEAEARAAWRAVFRPPQALMMVVVPGALEFGRLVYAVYLTAKRGILEFGAFLRTREAMDLIGDAARLSPEELARLKAGFQQAQVEKTAVEAHAKTLEMTDTEIRAFMHRRDTQPGMSLQDLLDEMTAWSATRAGNVPFGFQSADHFKAFAETAERELARVVKGKDPHARAYLQGSSLSGVSYKRHLPFDAESDLDIAISSKVLFNMASRELRLPVATGPSRIGPLVDESIAKLGLGRLRARLSDVLEAGQPAGQPARKINFMLFDDPKKVTMPIGQSSTEAARPARRLGT